MEKVGRIRNREEAWIQPRIQIAISMISKNKDFITCIDVGCVEGILGKLLREKFGDNLYIVGLDISERALKRADPYYDKLFQINLDSDELPKEVSEEKFDYIGMVEGISQNHPYLNIFITVGGKVRGWNSMDELFTQEIEKEYPETKVGLNCCLSLGRIFEKEGR